MKATRVGGFLWRVLFTIRPQLNYRIFRVKGALSALDIRSGWQPWWRGEKTYIREIPEPSPIHIVTPEEEEVEKREELPEAGDDEGKDPPQDEAEASQQQQSIPRFLLLQPVSYQQQQQHQHQYNARAVPRRRHSWMCGGWWAALPDCTDSWLHYLGWHKESCTANI